MKKVICTLVVLCLLAVTVSATDYVGDNVDLYVQISCPGKTVDQDLSDGEGLFMYYSYNLQDPDGVIREEEMQEYEFNLFNIANSAITADKAGTWTLYGEFIFLEFSGGILVDSGVCDSGTDTQFFEDAPLCGDGDLEGTEECDDSNLNNGDGCSDVCVVEFCGDGIVNNFEECDGSFDCDGSCNLIPPPAGADFILHQNVPGEQFIKKDGYVRKLAPTSNYGRSTRTYVEAGYYGVVSKGVDVTRLRRNYMELDLTAIVDNPSYTGGDVQSVILKLGTDGHSENPPIDVHRISWTWSETTLNWNNQPCKADFSLCKFSPKVTPSQVKTSMPNGDWIWSLDITDLVNLALNQGRNDVRLVMAFQDEKVYSPVDLMIRTKEDTDRCQRYLGHPYESYFCRTPQTLEVTI